MNLVPPGAPHPLFDSRAPENAELRNEILLDYLILSPVPEEYLFNENEDNYTVYSIPNLNDNIVNFSRKGGTYRYIYGLLCLYSSNNATCFSV